MKEPERAAQPPKSDGQSIKSLESTFAIVTELKEHKEATVTELAKATGLSKSSTYKHLTTLRQNHFVTKVGCTYKLGLRFLDVGGQIQTEIPGAKFIQETVRELAKETEETVQFAVAEHGRAVIVFREVGQHGVYSRGRIGKRFYIHQTSAGKAMLSQMSDEEIRQIAADQGLPQLTENTITDVETLLEEIHTIREQGYAINRDESTIGLRSVGVPIQGSNEKLIGAIAVIGPSNRLRGETLTTELPDLVQGVINELELNITYS